MRFDFGGVKQFLIYLNGQIPLGHVLDHPAYKTVSHHAQMFGGGITAQDVANALAGNPSPFYGLKRLRDHLPRITALLDLLDERQAEWCATLEAELLYLFPGEPLNITIYPILGYDMGIGLDGLVCMNINCAAYLDAPLEFLFYALHECVHVIYERSHRIPPLAQVNSSAEWRSYFNVWTQNEGFAVYAPLRLREKLGSLSERDYQVLFDAPQMETHRLAYWHAQERLLEEIPLQRDEYLEICFGDMRLTYRLGCELFRRIESTYGLTAVRRALMLDGDDFIKRYQHLLND